MAATGGSGSGGSTVPPRGVLTPAIPSADRKKVFGSRAPNIAIPLTGYPKEQTLVSELRYIDLSKFPIAATMLMRALMEVSDLHYRTQNQLQDQQKLANNIKISAAHMRARGKLSEPEKDMIDILCNKGGAMIEIATLQKMIHKPTHNLNRQFVNTLWDNIGCFVRACWA